MYRVIIFIGLVFISILQARAQDALDFNTINTETYRLFLSEEWDSVIALGNRALKQDVDYYYLRIRMGIAYYSRENYRKATIQFQRALKFYPGDPLALEYLYFALLMSGKEEQAGQVRKNFMGDLALKLPPRKGQFMKRTGGEYLHQWNLNEELFADPEAFFEGLPPGVQYVSGQFSNYSLSMDHGIAPGFELYHAYTYLSKFNLFYYNDGTNQFQLEDQHVYQHQYYISPGITTANGYVFRPMFHLVSVHYQSPVDFGTGFQGGTPQVLMGYTDATDYAAGLGFSKGIGTFDLHLGAYYSSLNNETQVQTRLGFMWYPTGSLQLYAGGFLNSMFEISGTSGVPGMIPELAIGAAIADKVWIDLGATMGSMNNYLEYNGAIVYNNFSEVIMKKVTLSLSIPVTGKGSLLFLGGRWTSNRSDFHPFEPANDFAHNPITYNTISIYGGITWKF
jgi:tetratricopeptide (TPR) repeat protein